MEMKLLALFALVAVCMAGASFAQAGDSGSGSSNNTAVLQISDYSTVPATAYPGTVGYARLTLSSTGTDTATSITLYYSYPETSSPTSMYVSDLSPGGSTQLTIPYRIPQQVATGLYVISIDVYYAPASATSQVKKTSLTIPIVISQFEALEVITQGTDKTALAAGDKIQLSLVVRNKGGVVNNLLVTTPQNSSFSIEGTTEKSIGSIPSNSSTNVTLSLISSSDAQVGQYTVPLIFTYQDAVGNTITQTLYVGPVSILESSTQFRLSMEPLTPTEVGSQALFQLTIENTGTNPLTAIVDVNATSQFIPLGVTRVYFEPIGPGESASKNISIGISSSTSAGYYTLPLTITLSSGKSSVQTIGIPVSATPTITISADTQPQPLVAGSTDGKVLIQVSNTGNAAIRSVYVTAQPADISAVGASDKFIGTLNVDDFATFQLGVSVPANAQAGAHQVPVTVTFKDSNNQLHTVNKTLEVEVSGTGAGFSQTGNSTARRSSGIIFGLNLVQLIGGLIVIVVVAGVGYWYFRKRKKKEGTRRHETA